MSDLIIKGHASSSYFWIVPVKVKDYNEDTDNVDNVEEYSQLEISIEEDDVWNLLFKFLVNNFDQNLKENLLRNGINPCNYITGDVISFEWNITYNYFTFDNIKLIIKDIKEEIKLSNLDLYKAKKYSKEIEIEFYNTFITLMENMITLAQIDGYKLISFMGP